MPQLLEPLQLFSHACLKQSLLHLLLHQISVKINQIQHTKMIVSTLNGHYKLFPWQWTTIIKEKANFLPNKSLSEVRRMMLFKTLYSPSQRHYPNIHQPSPKNNILVISYFYGSNSDYFFTKTTFDFQMS